MIFDCFSLSSGVIFFKTSFILFLNAALAAIIAEDEHLEVIFKSVLHGKMIKFIHKANNSYNVGKLLFCILVRKYKKFIVFKFK